jgi:folate-binding protein YgfZ
MSASPPVSLRDAQAALGASFAEHGGRGVVRAYGDASREYLAARERAGLFDLPERALLVATGPERRKFMQGMLSNDILAHGPGGGCRAALMTPKGGLLAWLRVLTEEDALLLEVDADRVELVQTRLEHHRVAAPVRFTARTATVLGLLGSHASEIAAEAGWTGPLEEPEAHRTLSLAGATIRLVRAGDLPGGGFVIHAAPEAAVAVWRRLLELGARPVGRTAVDALRIEALRPWYGWDVTEANLLHETGCLAEYHSATKGCYPGQEIVARLSARGAHVSKALRGLRLSVPARAGDAVTSGGHEVGRVTTAAVSPRLGPIAMGYLHRDHWDEGAAVAVGAAPATVVTRFEG